MGRQTLSPEEITGFQDQGPSMTGELRFSGPLRIDGNFDGSISTDNILTIGEHAVVRADIKAGEIEIYGSVAGDLDVSRCVKVHPTGSVNGDVRVPTFVIEPGGTFDGRSQMAESEGQIRAAPNESAMGGLGD